MSEGGLEAPTRHALAWRDPEFYDPLALDKEMRRVFDICHGCRRCFNLCDSFPRLFDLIDESETGELDSVDSAGFQDVVDACTLCDMCFMTKCPYVPPHEFALDFPHLMLRHRAATFKATGGKFVEKQISETQRNGKLAGPISGLVNWATRTENRLTRPLAEKVAGIHRDASIPKFYGKTFALQAKEAPPTVNRDAPAAGRKSVLFATCFVNYNNPAIGVAAQHVLAQNGVETAVSFPACCGMPKLEHGDIEAVVGAAQKISTDLEAMIDQGYAVIALIPSCALMFKFEWPLLLPDDEKVRKLADATFDLSEYIVDIARNEGLAEGMSSLGGGVSIHLACHARAQNFGPKGAELLKLIPDADVAVIERCSGHGGSWGMMKSNFETALKVGRPVARRAQANGKAVTASECPLAGEHIRQGMALQDPAAGQDEVLHPIQIMARAYGFGV